MKPAATVKTPLQQFIEHAQGTLKWLDGDAKKSVEGAINRAQQLLPIEKSHLCEAFRNGAEGVKHQSGHQYYRETYGYHENEL